MDQKGWYQSKAVWGGIVALLAGILGIFGFNVGAEDQAALAETLLAIGSAVGGLLAIYGRVSASKKIK